MHEVFGKYSELVKDIETKEESYVLGIAHGMKRGRDMLLEEQRVEATGLHHPAAALRYSEIAEMTPEEMREHYEDVQDAYTLREAGPSAEEDKRPPRPGWQDRWKEKPEGSY